MVKYKVKISANVCYTCALNVAIIALIRERNLIVCKLQLLYIYIKNMNVHILIEVSALYPQHSEHICDSALHLSEE